jgi:RecB family exonuclease
MAVIEGQESFPGMPSPLFAASPSRLLAFQDCPRRYRFQYLDRPTPQRRSQRAHTSLGIAVHNALRDWWDMPIAQRNPGGGAALVERAWISVGFRDGSQSARWRERSKNAVAKYLEQVDPAAQPVGIERTVAFVTEGLRVSGRIDRLDDRGGELVVIDYKTSRVVPTADDARTSLALGLYAAAVWKMFRRPALRVEVHHVPSGEVASHLHTPEGIARKVAQARGIARDAQRAEADLAELGEESTAFPPSTGPLCTWCDFRAHCPQGQAVGPERSDWAALEEDGPVPASAEVD